jgi:hypothetical protein
MNKLLIGLIIPYHIGLRTHDLELAYLEKLCLFNMNKLLLKYI